MIKNAANTAEIIYPPPNSLWTKAILCTFLNVVNGGILHPLW